MLSKELATYNSEELCADYMAELLTEKVKAWNEFKKNHIS
jgi:hypothetical protein